MPAAIQLHNDLMRRRLRDCGGYEFKTEGDTILCSFPTVMAALIVAKQPPRDYLKGRFTSTTQALQFSSVLSPVLSPVRPLVSLVLTILREKPSRDLFLSSVLYPFTRSPPSHSS